MLVHLDAGQRQQIVDQPAHARGLHAHDVEEVLARHVVVLGMAAQRVDEAGHGRQRRAQFMAGIGDEVGPHLFGAPDRGEIVQQQRDHRRARR